jgi:hypothetical protein
MIELLKPKKQEVVVTKHDAVKVSTTQQNRSGSYVNLECIVNDHSLLVMEYLDNEIANLKRKISNLEKERSLVSELYQVVQSKKGS